MQVPSRSLPLFLLALLQGHPQPAESLPECAAPRAQAVAEAEDLEQPGAAGELELLEAFERTTVDLAERIRPSLVTVSAYARLPESPEAAAAAPDGWRLRPSSEYPGFGLLGSGSGVVLSKAGDIVTNRHFLLQPDGRPADLIDVETSDLRHTIAELAGAEPTLNLAVVQLRVYAESNPPRFEPLALADSSQVRVGQLAFAAGDPFGPESYFSMGLIAGTPGRDCYQELLSASYLQATLPMTVGAFGGALLNRRGELVGLLSYLPSQELDPGAFASQGSAFALPSNIVSVLYGTIQRSQSFKSPWMGWAVMSLAELTRERGVESVQQMQLPRVGIYVENVFEGSPAALADIQPGDFLTRFNGEYVGSPLDFQKQLYLAGIGRQIECEFFRAGERFTRQFTIAERPAEAITR